MQKINDAIINNLYEFWKHIGMLNNRLIETEMYCAVSMINSDWPNRVFNINNGVQSIDTVHKLGTENKLPKVITLTQTNEQIHKYNYEFALAQRNMSLDLKEGSFNNSVNPNIFRVKTEEDATDFAKIASGSFGYRVDPKVVFTLVEQSTSTRLFLYKEEQSLGCGIVFFDSFNNAGLHMIGTIPEGRGKGIAKSMTEKLVGEAKSENKNLCVLHASLMGESIYKKLGFEPHGKIETYKIVEK